MFAAGTSLWDSSRYEPRLMGLQGQSEIFFCGKGQNPKTTQRWSMQYVSRSGRPYPNIVHNVQSPALKQTRLPYIKISRICRHSRQSVVSNPSACRIVESRIHYVKQKEWQECDTPCFFIKRLYAVSTLGKSPRDFRGSCCT